MNNSKLVSYTKISPNCNKPRNHKIDTITIHHMAGNLTLEACGNALLSREGSCNYAIDSNGKIGMYVEECNRAWTTNSPENDHRAITIEVANDVIGGNWHVSDKALASLIDLCVDICQRNGIAKLNFTGDKSGNVTIHKWFWATACPGPYLESRIPYVVSEVNKRLTAAQKTPEPTRVLDSSGFKKGDRSAGVLAFKCMLMAAKKQGYIERTVNCDDKYTSGVEQIVNYFLKKWGYVQNGIAGEGFIKKMNSAILKKIK